MGMDEENTQQHFCETLVFYVNGKKIVDAKIDPEWTLLFYLRTKLRLTGTKLGCGEGGCGACTVMVSRFDRRLNKEVHIPVNACLAPVCSLHGMAVTTVEGIGSTRTKLHPIQERIAKSHGSQCGFCTPGMVMSMYALLRQSSKPKMRDMEEALQGNLCRCTGYRPILDGFKTFTAEWEAERNRTLVNGSNGVCGLGDKCCKLQIDLENTNDLTTDDDPSTLVDTNAFAPYHPSQEPIFPPELKLSDIYDRQNLIIKGQNVTWYRPTTFQALLNLTHDYPRAKIVVGNTEIGVETKFKQMLYPVLIQPVQIEELTEIVACEGFVKVGASVSLTNLGEFLENQIQIQPEEKTRLFRAVIDILFTFAGKQIRSVGSIGGNIMTGSPISDLIPLLMVARVELEVSHYVTGDRIVILDDKFFTGYRRNVILTGEVLKAVRIPYSHENQYFEVYKQSRRREDDIAIVNAAIHVTFEANSSVVSTSNLAFGGMSFKTVTAPKTEKNLTGLHWNKETLDRALTWLSEDLPLDSSAPGGMVQYRKSLALGLFFKAFLAISKRLAPNALDTCELGDAKGIPVPKQTSSQYFSRVLNDGEKYDTVHRPVVHISGYKQATGEAVYCDDIPTFEDELYLSYVVSTRSYARVLSIDPFEALKVLGVRGIVSANDIEKNIYGPLVRDEKIFYDDIVTSQGQIICAVVAKDQLTARKAARLVRVEYEDLEPVIITIEDAIKYRTFFEGEYRTISRGNVDKAFEEAPHVLEGECRIGGQEHFYLETQTVIAVPKKEDDEMLLYVASQHPAGIVSSVAELLGIDQNQVVCKVKRIGGGFGGKETKALMVTLPVVVAAKKFNRPIRLALDRDDDMAMTGGRHPCLIKYKVAFDVRGKILGFEARAYLNGGYSYDFSLPVCEKIVTVLPSAYNIPNLRISGVVCKTNLPSNTAFRGFGNPQAVFAAETVIQHIADYLKIDRVRISEINFYKEGDLTHYNQKLIDCTLERCWSECMKMSNYHERKKNVEFYNRQNRYYKRGLAVVPTVFGVGFSDAQFLNQAGALVHVYNDGSVLLHHGGVEMGQGLYTKMIQIASKVLNVPIEKVHTSTTSTQAVPNTSPTAASTGSDLNGMAVLNACSTIKERLEPYRKADPNGTWESWVSKAYFERVSLSATGFHAMPNIGYDWAKGEGNMFNYFVYGVACSEVEVDSLTGDHRVLRTDIVMDLGQSLNPAIDIGQIEGAFMQGYGLYVLEELVYSPTGTMFTKGPGTYKIPGFGDIPAQFNVSLLKGSSNTRAVYSSKAVGEPPLTLASSTLFAIKDAIKAARSEHGVDEYFVLDAPATVEKIRMACKDNITEKIKEPELGSYKPWNIVV